MQSPSRKLNTKKQNTHQTLIKKYPNWSKLHEKKIKLNRINIEYSELGKIKKLKISLVQWEHKFILIMYKLKKKIKKDKKKID